MRGSCRLLLIGLCFCGGCSFSSDRSEVERLEAEVERLTDELVEANVQLKLKEEELATLRRQLEDPDGGEGAGPTLTDQPPAPGSLTADLAGKRLEVSIQNLRLAPGNPKTVYVGRANEQGERPEVAPLRVSVSYGGDFTTGGLFKVGEQSLPLRIASSDSAVVQLDEFGSVVFGQPGEAMLTVSLGGARIDVPFHVVELPVPPCDEKAAASLLGVPDQRLLKAVSWPNSVEVDGITYVPSAADQIIYEHWRYAKFPAAVLAWKDSELTITTCDPGP